MPVNCDFLHFSSSQIGAFVRELLEARLPERASFFAAEHMELVGLVVSPSNKVYERGAGCR